jgi:hypothetical protein
MGIYDTYADLLTIDHDVDGILEFKWILGANNSLKLLKTYFGTRYFLNGCSVNNFNYDALFYSNILYFLLEYGAWEKTCTSQEGAINEFDVENYLRFTPGTNADKFESSQDRSVVTSISLYWDYCSQYCVEDVSQSSINKHLTLDYDFLGSDYFDLYIISK